MTGQGCQHPDNVTLWRRFLALVLGHSHADSVEDESESELGSAY